VNPCLTREAENTNSDGKNFVSPTVDIKPKISEIFALVKNSII
jgi:hypothetical protein